jgi:hypothetical protein
LSRLRSPSARRLTRRVGLALAVLGMGVAAPLASASPASAGCAPAENQLAGGAWMPDAPSERTLTPFQFQVRCDAPVKVYIHGAWNFVQTGRIVQTPTWWNPTYVATLDGFPNARITMRYRVEGTQQYLNVRVTGTGDGSTLEGVLYHDLSRPSI